MNPVAQQRCLVVLMVLAIFVEVASRANFSLAIVAMVAPEVNYEEVSFRERIEALSSRCTYDIRSIFQPPALSPGPKYHWSPSTQGVLLGISR